jgi:phosphatidylinositol alpha-mannosyltransferase
MKIALVSPYDFAYPGGVTTHVTHLSHEFTRWGHTVKILAPSSKPPSILKVDNLVHLGTPIPVPWSGSIARISVSAWLAPRIGALLEEERFDVIHLHEPFLPLPLQVLGRSRTTNIGTFHAYRRRSPVYPWAKAPLARWSRKLHGRIAVSTPARDHINRYFPGEYQVIPNSIDVDHFARPAPPFPQFKDGKVNLLFVGRLEKRKGLRYLLRAYGRLKWEHPDIRLLVVGPGTPDKDSLRIMGERSLKDVVFTGGVPYSDLPRYYHTADIFCAPAIDKESQGLVLLEAMAAGKPIVASNIEGYASVLQEGVQGLLVPPKDDAALAQALGRLLQDPSLRHQMAARGPANAQEYRRERIAARVLEFYEATLERTGAAVSASPLPGR